MAETTKKKSNSSFWVIFIILILLVITILVIRSKKSAVPMDQPPAQATNAAATTTTYISVDDNTILKRGMNNAHVSKLQTLINKVNTAYGLPLISVDGAFGPGTEAALLKLTGKTQISYAQAESMANEKFKSKGYTDNMITSIFSGLSFGIFG